nr:acyl-CoA N-acyltransferase [Tanacetum cinerariifolium]
MVVRCGGYTDPTMVGTQIGDCSSLFGGLLFGHSGDWCDSVNELQKIRFVVYDYGETSDEDVDENENVGLRRKTGSLKVLVNKHKSVGNGQVNDLKEAKSGLLERKKVKLDRGVSEGRDASKKSVDLSGLKHSKNKVVSSSSKNVEVKLKTRTVVESDKEMDNTKPMHHRVAKRK